MDVQLEVRQVEKHFGGIHAVDGCSLAVSRQSITGLIGPNGAGKTTLFNVITGFYKPDGGEIWFNQTRVDGLPPHEIARKALCRTFQIPRELKEMTVLENLMLVPGHQAGEKIWNTWFFPGRVRAQEREIRRKAEEVLEFVELIHLKDEYAKNLSTGQKKLLELARTLMADPEMILLDEPGAGVNRSLMKKLVENIHTLRSLGKTFFVIEHDMNLITELCERVIVMSKGKELAVGTFEEIKADDRVIEAYLGGQV
jgi:branched-chain amino acid transport system ATP-binding protein